MGDLRAPTVAPAAPTTEREPAVAAPAPAQSNTAAAARAERGRAERAGTLEDEVALIRAMGAISDEVGDPTAEMGATRLIGLLRTLSAADQATFRMRIQKRAESDAIFRCWRRLPEELRARILRAAGDGRSALEPTIRASQAVVDPGDPSATPRRAASSMGREEFGSGYDYKNPEMDRLVDGAFLDPAADSVRSYAQDIERADVADELPQPLPAIVGQVGYYEARALDFERRSPGSEPPEYYRLYGGKYAQRFTEQLYPKLTLEGRVWLVKARMLLQLAIENELLKSPAAFAALERDSKAFTAFAYASHAPAYLAAGLRTLGIRDKAAIASTPDLKDLFTIDGLLQALEVSPDAIGGYLDRLMQVGEDFLEDPVPTLGEVRR